MKTKLCFAQQLALRVSLVALTAVMLAALVGSGWAQETSGSPVVEKSMQVGASEVMDFQDIKRAAVSDPAVVDYVVLSAKQIMVTAKQPGVSSLTVWDSKGQHTFHVVVAAPPSRMPEIVNKIRESIADPAIKVSAHNEVIILEGEVDTAYAGQRAEAIARAYTAKVENLIQVRAKVEKPPLDLEAIQAAVGPGVNVTALTENTLLFDGTAAPEQKVRIDQILRALEAQVTVVDMVTAPAYKPRQILVHVKVMDINKSAMRDVGIDWGGLDAAGPHAQPILFGEFSLGPYALDEAGPIRRLEALSARLQALVTSNRARILAEPNLLVVEGETAEMLVGGEIPIPVVQTTTGPAAAGAVTVEWKEYGVKLTMQGTVGADGESIDLEVTPEVSTIDPANAIEVSGIWLPALRTRRAHSVLHMEDGQTLVIGGLYQVEWSKSVRRIPILSELPILGELFKSTSKQRRETELVILVTPQIVTEASAAARTEKALETVREVE